MTLLWQALYQPISPPDCFFRPWQLQTNTQQSLHSNISSLFLQDFIVFVFYWSKPQGTNNDIKQAADVTAQITRTVRLQTSNIRKFLPRLQPYSFQGNFQSDISITLKTIGHFCIELSLENKGRIEIYLLNHVQANLKLIAIIVKAWKLFNLILQYYCSICYIYFINYSEACNETKPDGISKLHFLFSNCNILKYLWCKDMC